MFNIAIPETVVLSTRQTKKQFEKEAKKAIALKFYVDERLSLGQAAELADLTKFEFVKYLGENKVSIFRYETDNYAEELQKEIETSQRYSMGERIG